MVATGVLMLLFGSYETSDAWADALQVWWRQVRRSQKHVKRLVIYLDNGPKNSGRRTQFLKRMVQFADWSGLEVRLVYYPPYHSKYNPIERCWSILEQKWNGELLNCLEVVLQCARREAVGVRRLLAGHRDLRRLLLLLMIVDHHHRDAPSQCSTIFPPFTRNVSKENRS